MYEIKRHRTLFLITNVSCTNSVLTHSPVLDVLFVSYVCGSYRPEKSTEFSEPTWIIFVKTGKLLTVHDISFCARVCVWFILRSQSFTRNKKCGGLFLQVFFQAVHYAFFTNKYTRSRHACLNALTAFNNQTLSTFLNSPKRKFYLFVIGGSLFYFNVKYDEVVNWKGLPLPYSHLNKYLTNSTCFLPVD